MSRAPFPATPPLGPSWAQARVAIDPGLFLKICAAILVALSLANALAILVYDPHSPRIVRLSHAVLFHQEASFPMLYNFALLLADGVILALATLRAFGARDRWRFHWLGAAAAFVVLSYDEAAQFHSTLIPLARMVVKGDGALWWALRLLGAAALIMLVVGYLRFLLGALPRRMAGVAVVAGALYLGGAVGFELMTDALFAGAPERTLFLLSTVEETLEMAGLIVFGYALLAHLARDDGRVGIGVDL
jgi:hypothetical protein